MVAAAKIESMKLFKQDYVTKTGADSNQYNELKQMDRIRDLLWRLERFSAFSKLLLLYFNRTFCNYKQLFIKVL